MIASFNIGGLIYFGIILKEDLVGRIIYGSVFILVGIEWIELLFYKKKRVNE